MPVSHEDKIKEQALPYLEAGEHVLAAFMARPRGATTAGAGGWHPPGPAVADGSPAAAEAPAAPPPPPPPAEQQPQ